MTSDVFRYSPRAFEKAVDAGVFGDRKVELLRGVPYVMTQHPPHIFVVLRCGSSLRTLFPADRWSVHTESAIRVGNSRPVPDLTVVRQPEPLYLGRLAGPSDIRLIVEVADTTWAKDRGKKYRLYAEAGIPEYWIIRLDRREAHVFTEPVGSHYRHAVLYTELDSLPIESSSVALSDLLPPA